MGRSIRSFFKGSTRAAGVVGISLAPTAVAVAHLLPAAQGTTRLQACGVQAVGSVADQAEALKSLVKSHGLTGHACVHTLEPGAYSLLQIEKPPVEGDELRQAARWRIKDLIEYPVTEAVVDVFEIPGLQSRGRSPAVYVAASHRDELQRRAELIEAAGLKLQQINIAELALRNVGALAAQGSESIAVLHLEERRGQIAILRESALYVARVMDSGLAQLQDVARAVGEDEIDTTAARMEAYDRIALEVQRTMDYYDSYFAQPPVRRMLILPDGPAIEELAGYARSSLGLTVETPSLSALLGGAEGDPISADCLLAVAGALDEAAP